MGAGSNDIIFDNLTRVSRSRYIFKSNISKRVRHGQSYYRTLIDSDSALMLTLCALQMLVLLLLLLF